MKPPAAPADLDDLDDQALHWFVRQLAGLNSAEAAQLQAWLAAAPAHGESLNRWTQQWDELDALPAAGVHRLRRQLKAELAQVKPSRPWNRNWRFGMACLVALLLGMGGITDSGRDDQQQALHSQSFATARGQQLSLTLPDGSRLLLDSATRGEAILYRKRREVHLPEGQAMFEVQKDPERPFDVMAGPLRVTVLGTRFAVRYTPASLQDGRVHIAVEEGRVRIADAKHAEKAVELLAGQQVDSDQQGRLGAVSSIPPAEVASWREGRVSFEDATLAQVLAEFERYGETGLVLNDSRVAALRLTGTFDPRRLENFRRVLPQVLPVRLQTRGEWTEILAAP